MTHLLEHLPHLLLHTLLDTCKLLPFLFLTYLLMEYLEHKSGGKLERMLLRSNRIGPLVGGLLGVIPQCGFSAASVGLYTGRVITTGTLLAVWLSTSDEMLPILISEGTSPVLILKILGFKLVAAILAGFAVDLVARALRKHNHLQTPAPQIEDFCEREHCRCEEHFVLSALRHTAKITLFIFLITFALNVTIEGIGEDRLAALVLDRPVIGNLLAATVGLIPNCASSVVLTELYLGGVIGVGSMLSGLLVNAGIGTAILLRNNRPVRDSLRILLLLWCLGAAVGMLVDLTPLALLF
ncbi:MAG: hypothetical protein E7666_06665 [Ruminococcaceae bacterium]|nr:hypothetical protein [Oscillospiraceae bacterium]